MESRPDRIIVSSSLNVHSVTLLGNGSYYKQRYKALIHFDRFMSILNAAKLSYHGVSGYSCMQDCGPHGSCQCGICVGVGNNQNCDLPNCPICDVETYKTIRTYCIISVIIILHLFYSVVLVLTIGAGSYGNTIHSILGFQCCLFNPDLCKKSVRNFQRKNKFLRLLHIWPIFRLPPYVQLLLSSVTLTLFLLYVRNKLDAIFILSYSTLVEEFFPSDHLMLTAHLT